ncbi:hypothetical protein SPG90_20740 (plasmid) [Enterobacter sp. D2]|uniref:hypothetical protein n=1 Tax=Enterobacter sp. D2 TaxID=3102784 RepID=UPI002ACA173B|nr:hypothetical protein [Enterobacter sp. D2]MDZ5730931.1 hypothetical protein [Enterobacter sp. D2]
MSDITINQLVQEIKSKRNDLEATRNIFNAQSSTIEFEIFDRDHWSHFAFNDSIIKLILLTENNFNAIETFSLVSTSRYILELSIRLTLIAQDSVYGLEYYGRLLRDQLQYWTGLKEQLNREIVFLHEMEEKERKLHHDKLLEYSKIEDPELKEKFGVALTPDVFNTIDNMASRKFSIHAAQARTNGYGFQAHLIQKNQLPEVESSLETVKKDIEKFNSSVSSDVKQLLRYWNWKDYATETNHAEDYDYIYTFTSRMLHAVPVNITTNHPFLSNDEMIIFLKYINVKIADINELANTFISNSKIGKI